MQKRLKSEKTRMEAFDKGMSVNAFTDLRSLMASCSPTMIESKRNAPVLEKPVQAAKPSLQEVHHD
jgi:hypothetical protein